MTTYLHPVLRSEARAEPQTIYTVANGDLRPSANTKCWPTQQQLEADLGQAIAQLGYTIQRAHDVDPDKGHGFIDSQRRGIEVFRDVPPDAPLIVVEAVWQYSHQLLPGLRSHRGPILVVANWAGDFPGLVGLLNLTGSLTKAGIAYSALWSGHFTDNWASRASRSG